MPEFGLCLCTPTPELYLSPPASVAVFSACIMPVQAPRPSMLPPQPAQQDSAPDCVLH